MPAASQFNTRLFILVGRPRRDRGLPDKKIQLFWRIVVTIGGVPLSTHSRTVRFKRGSSLADGCLEPQCRGGGRIPEGA